MGGWADKKRDTRRAVDSKRPELTLSGVGDVTFAGRVHCAACHARGTFLYETVISSRAAANIILRPAIENLLTQLNAEELEGE